MGYNPDSAIETKCVQAGYTPGRLAAEKRRAASSAHL